MLKEGKSKVARGGQRALETLGLRRRSRGVPLVAAIAGLALAAGAVYALSLARRALAGLALRPKPPSGATSQEKRSGANGTPVEAPPHTMEGAEAEELGRAENEGMHPGLW
jgi:hypothetical protein